MRKSLISHHFKTLLSNKNLYELSAGYLNYPIPNSYIWASFKTFRKWFCPLQEAKWIIVINHIFKFAPYLEPFHQLNYWCEFFPGYPNYPIETWHFKANVNTTWKMFFELHETISLIVIGEIFKFLTNLDNFVRETICVNCF